MHKFYQSLILWRFQTLSRLSLGKNRVKMSSPFPITVISILFPSRRTNSPGKELCYLSVRRKNRPSAIFPSDGRIDSTLKQTILWFKFITSYHLLTNVIPSGEWKTITARGPKFLEHLPAFINVFGENVEKWLDCKNDPLAICSCFSMETTFEYFFEANFLFSLD